MISNLKILVDFFRVLQLYLIKNPKIVISILSCHRGVLRRAGVFDVNLT